MQFHLMDYFGIIYDIVQYFIYFAQEVIIAMGGGTLSISWPAAPQFSFYCVEERLVINLSTSYSELQKYI